MTDKTLTIRRADITDAGALTRLAELDSSSPPTGDVLVAEIGDELWAAIEINSCAAVADPFRPSGALIGLLRLHARRARGDEPERGRLGRLLPRVA